MVCHATEALTRNNMELSVAGPHGPNYQARISFMKKSTNGDTSQFSSQLMSFTRTLGIDDANSSSRRLNHIADRVTNAVRSVIAHSFSDLQAKNQQIEAQIEQIKQNHARDMANLEQNSGERI